MKNQRYFGIYINNKIPKVNDEKNKFNKYYGNIKLNFKGKAFIINNKNEIIELKSNSKYKKSGKHIIKYIDERNEVYYINVNIIKIYPLLLLLLLFFILSYFILFNDDTINNNNEINKKLNFDVELDGLKYSFNVNYKNQNFKSVVLTDKVTQSNMLYPGASGYFYIEISTKNGNKDMFYTMEANEEKNKPTNMKFKINNTEYNSITELSKDVKGIVPKHSNEILKIEWFWDYDSDNIIDTNDGINTSNYNFSIRIIGTENI